MPSRSDRRLRALLMLLVRLAEDPTDPDGEMRREFDAALDAAAAARLLDEGEIDALRRRAAPDADPVAPPLVDPARRAELADLLQRLARDAVAAGDSPRADDAHGRLHDAMLAATTLGLEMQNPFHPGSGEADDEWGEPALLGLRAVLPGPPARGGQQLVSVECYDDGLVLRLRRTRQVPEHLRDAEPDALHEHFMDLDTPADWPEVSDDVGTAYWSQGGDGSSGLENDRWVSSWRRAFAPAVPREARILIAVVAGEGFEVDVTGVAERVAV